MVDFVLPKLLVLSVIKVSHCVFRVGMKLIIIICGLIYAPVILTMERGESSKLQQKSRILRASASLPDLITIEKGQKSGTAIKRPRKARRGQRLLQQRPLRVGPESNQR